MKESNKSIWILLFIASMLSVHAFAAETTQLSIDAATCWLKERGVAVKKNPISIAGRMTDDGCHAFISDDEFNRRFEFCVYSGFDMAGGGEAAYYGCGFSREKDSYMFRAYMSYEGLVNRKPDLTCYYMCYKK